MQRRSSPVSRNALVTLLVIVLCGGILALFTDAELRLVRWVNCGPLASPASRNIPDCS